LNSPADKVMINTGGTNNKHGDT